jgi:hypothetical protein
MEEGDNNDNDLDDDDHDKEHIVNEDERVVQNEVLESDMNRVGED